MWNTTNRVGLFLLIMVQWMPVYYIHNMSNKSNLELLVMSIVWLLISLFGGLLMLIKEEWMV